MSHSNNVRNNEIMTIMNIEIVIYTHLLKHVKRINFEGLLYRSNIRINFDAMSINQFKNSAFIQC